MTKERGEQMEEWNLMIDVVNSYVQTIKKTMQSQMFVWCRWRELNPHARRHMALNHACLPVSPHRHYCFFFKGIHFLRCRIGTSSFLFIPNQINLCHLESCLDRKNNFSHMLLPGSEQTREKLFLRSRRAKNREQFYLIRYYTGLNPESSATGVRKDLMRSASSLRAPDSSYSP